MLWISDQVYLIVALATTSVILFAVRDLRLPPRLFLIPDVLGLALFIVVGTQIALEWNAPWRVASLLGVITGVVGGALRDVLCSEVPLIFVRGELYASAAWTGALMLVGRQAVGVLPVIAAWAGMASVLGVRLLAMAFRITSPIYAERKSGEVATSARCSCRHPTSEPIKWQDEKSACLAADAAPHCVCGMGPV